jgi:4-carboxymuconolactone decarboxylase
MCDSFMITIAILEEMGKNDELRKHLKGARHQGISHDQIVEIFIHVAHYAVWPAGHHALKILDGWEKEYLAKSDLKSGGS